MKHHRKFTRKLRNYIKESSISESSKKKKYDVCTIAMDVNIYFEERGMSASRIPKGLIVRYGVGTILLGFIFPWFFIPISLNLHNRLKESAIAILKDRLESNA
jgi:hypothetical protein